jgi:hypothetical protein
MGKENGTEKREKVPAVKKPEIYLCAAALICFSIRSGLSVEQPPQLLAQPGCLLLACCQNMRTR